MGKQKKKEEEEEEERRGGIKKHEKRRQERRGKGARGDTSEFSFASTKAIDSKHLGKPKGFRKSSASAL